MKRTGLTLLELVVSMASSIILVAGLAGSLYISSQALPDPSDPARQSAQAATVVREIMSDVGLALSFTERTSRAITFTVPDRNGDNTPETIRYEWSGTAGDPLTYQYNSGSVITMAADVQSFNLEALTRVMSAEALSAPVATEVKYEEFTKNKASSSVTTISVAKPASTIEGSLLIAAVSLDGEARGSLAAPGWNLVAVGPGVAVPNPAAQTFGVWWKIATSSEPSSYAFNWSGGRQAYAWIMRFSGHDVTPANTINAFAVDSMGGMLGALSPNSPAVTTSVANAMILRLGGFDGSKFAANDSGATPGVPGLLLHTIITADRSSSSGSNCSGAAGWVVQAAPGNSGATTFVLIGTEQYSSVTIAITPAQAD